MIAWARRTRGFAAGILAAAFLLASQIILSSAIASQMEALDLILGSADQAICASDSGQSDHTSPGSSALHKKVCDICAFAAQSGVAPASAFALVVRLESTPATDDPQPSVILSRQTHEPRLTRGPPLDA